MFATLFLKECKQILRSLVFYIYAIVLIFFMTSQMGERDFQILDKPESGLENYGTKPTDDKVVIMKSGVRELMLETSSNAYNTYPFGFVKTVELNENELSIVKSYLQDITGKSYRDLETEMTDYFAKADEKYSDNDIEGYMSAYNAYTVNIREDLTYEEFLNIMEKIAKLVGRGSSYEQTKLEMMASEPMTYEDALKEYNEILEKDHISGAYARLFCDYAGIILSILPVFLGVTRCLRDKRSKVTGVIYVKEVSTFTLMLSRYLANVAMAFLPVVLVALLVQMPYLYHAKTLGMPLDYFVFLRYIAVWLLPQIMVVMGLAFFLTELLENIFPIFVQILWAGASLFRAETLVGDFGYQLVLRWNTVGKTSQFFEQIDEWYVNRTFYLLLAFVFVGGSVLAAAYKRKEGVTVFGKIFKTGQ